MAIFKVSTLGLSALAEVSKMICLLVKIITIAIVILHISQGVQSRAINKYDLVVRGKPLISRTPAGQPFDYVPETRPEIRPAIAPQPEPGSLNVPTEESQTNVAEGSVLTKVSGAGSAKWDAKVLDAPHDHKQQLTIEEYEKRGVVLRSEFYQKDRKDVTFPDITTFKLYSEVAPTDLETPDYYEYRINNGDKPDGDPVALITYNLDGDDLTAEIVYLYAENDPYRQNKGPDENGNIKGLPASEIILQGAEKYIDAIAALRVASLKQFKQIATELVANYGTKATVADIATRFKLPQGKSKIFRYNDPDVAEADRPLYNQAFDQLAGLDNVRPSLRLAIDHGKALGIDDVEIEIVPSASEPQVNVLFIPTSAS